MFAAQTDCEFAARGNICTNYAYCAICILYLLAWRDTTCGGMHDVMIDDDFKNIFMLKSIGFYGIILARGEFVNGKTKNITFVW